ncbi:MAG TPA: ATP-binding protein [Anaeromyxobacter sp.]
MFDLTPDVRDARDSARGADPDARDSARGVNPGPSDAGDRALEGAFLPATLERLAHLTPRARLATALGVAVIASLLRILLVPLMGLESPYVTLFPAVMFVALLVGITPGIVAAAAVTVATEAWLGRATGFVRPGSADLARFAILVLSAAVLGRVGARLRAVHTSLRRANAELRAVDLARSETVARLRRLADELQAGRAQAREREARFRAITEAMPQIVCVLAPDGSPEYVNAQWMGFSGLTLAETVRAGWALIVHPDDLALVRDCRRRALETGAPQEVELRYRAASGSYRWFLSRLAPVRGANGRVVRFVGAAMDITTRKEAEEALRDADRRKTEFLAMLSHELRNPLAPIRNSVYVLAHADPTGEGARRARAVIERQSEHLTRLVDDLLDVTRIARGKIDLRRAHVDLRDLVRRAGEDLRSTLESRGLVLSVELPPEPVLADADTTRLEQVVGNLLQNASKFTPRGGRVTLALAHEGGEAVIRVRDTGIGIDPELLGRVFEPFVQAERSLARTQGGLGLGLALVKGIAELHGGSVRAESAGPGHGAVVAVRVPALAAR